MDSLILNTLFIANSRLKDMLKYLEQGKRDSSYLNALNNGIKDCLLILKKTKLDAANKEYLGRIDGVVSQNDFNAIKMRIEKIIPSEYGRKSSFGRITGGYHLEENIDYEISIQNIKTVGESIENALTNLQKNVLENAQKKNEKESELPDFLISSFGSVYEVMEKLIKRYGK